MLKKIGVRVALFDYKKAFDLIDYTILVEKLMAWDIPHVFCAESSIFLKIANRVKLEQDCKSEWRDILAGVPQGTKLGPWLFILMIDDINASDTEIWKYVGDTTIAEPVAKNQASTIQDSVDDLVAKSGQVN